jgi:predicted N-acyltransferase
VSALPVKGYQGGREMTDPFSEDVRSGAALGLPVVMALSSAALIATTVTLSGALAAAALFGRSFGVVERHAPWLPAKE